MKRLIRRRRDLGAAPSVLVGGGPGGRFTLGKPFCDFKFFGTISDGTVLRGGGGGTIDILCRKETVLDVFANSFG